MLQELLGVKVPGKPEPAKAKTTQPPSPPSSAGAAGAKAIPVSSSPVPPIYDSRSPSPLAGLRMGEAPISLDMARAELQKLKDASLSDGDPSRQLRKDLAVIS